jgi:hypothetical protein
VARVLPADVVLNAGDASNVSKLTRARCFKPAAATLVTLADKSGRAAEALCLLRVEQLNDEFPVISIHPIES